MSFISLSRLIKLSLLIMIISIPLIVSAKSIVDDAKINRIHLFERPAPNGSAYITLNKTRNTSPCTGNQNEFHIDLTTKHGQLLYSHALSAFHAKSKVKIIGTGICGLYSVETISDLQIYH